MSDQPPRDYATVSALDSKSSREAELEELRQKSLAQSNAQKLAETAVTPINMMDWQAQQKVMKDQDRMSKTETAKFLHGYRGNTDESGVSMLSSIKQEDRKGKEDAARFLRSYRGDAGTPLRKIPVGKAEPNAFVHGTMPADQRSGEASVASLAAGFHMQADQRSGEESVATLAAGFHQNGAAQDVVVPTAGTNMAESPESMVIVDASSSPTDESTGVQDVVATPGKSMAESTESLIIVDTSSSPTDESKESSPILAKDGTRHAGEDDWVSVESSNVPSPEKVEDLFREMQAQEIPVDSFDSNDAFDTDDISRAVTEVAGNIDADDDDDSDATPLTEAQLHASGSRGGHLSLRLDVDFSFGVVTDELQPDADKYMKGVAAIAHLLFTENRPAGSMGSGHAVYNTNFYPFVRFVEKSNAAPKTFIVHASLPMFILDWAQAPNTRVEVRNALKAAVQDGRLLCLSRQ